MGRTPPLITLSGPSAAGTTTCSELLAMAFGYEVLNGGDIVRELAAEREVSVADVAAEAGDDPAVDRELDARLEAAIDAHLEGTREPAGEGLVVDAPLAGWHADGRATLSVWLDAPLEVRADRIDDPSLYDLVIDTGTLSEEGTFRTVKTAIDDVRGVEHTYREL